MAETDLGRHCVPATRRAFLDSILNTTFVGLAGKFKLVNGEQQVPSYEIMNVTGEGTKGVGLWTPLYLLSQNLSTEVSSFDNSRSGTGTLNPMFWQEDTVITSKVHEKIGFTFTVDIKPSIDSETENRNTRELLGRNSWKLRGNHTKTWKLRGNHTKTLLKIAVPQKYGFKTFVNVSYPYFFCEENVTRHGTMRQKVIGYSIDIFDATMKMLEHPPCYEFCVFSGPYDELVSNVSSGNFDGAVGDVTITAERTRQVDFTMPYTQSGVSLLVLSQNKLKPIQWTFLAPLTKELWFATVGFFVFTGFVVWMIERPRNPEYQGSSLRQFSTTLYFSFSTLTFSHDPIIRSPLSKIVVVIWCFVVLVIVQSYTASLSSKLTADMLRPSVTDLEQLLFNGDYVGYQQGSFVCSILRNRGFSENRLIPYVTSEEYAEALRKGWVSAIADEIPYFTSFFSDPQYQEEFQMLNTIYKTPGFAFVFPLGSPLVHNLSTAVLILTGEEEGSKIEDRWLGVPRSYASSNRDFVPLTLQSFSGLFLTSGFISSLMLLISIVRLVHARWTYARNADAQSVGNSAANEESRPLQNGTGNISPHPEARNDDYQGVYGSGGHGGDEESRPVQNDSGNNSVRGQVLHEATSNESQVACRNGGSDGHEELSAVQNGVGDDSVPAQSFRIEMNTG